MQEYIIAYDLGTGGLKASLYNMDGTNIYHVFKEYPTTHPYPGQHEQCPEQWWKAIIQTTHTLIEKAGISGNYVRGISISGHSLGLIPIDKNGQILLKSTPIWSDTRASAEANCFFQTVSYKEWYLRTGNGFPKECYPLFKLIWLKQNYPSVFHKAHMILGTKDYINYKLTGKLYTDHSYASGSGFYDLHTRTYINEYLQTAGISPSIFPDIIPSHAAIGTLTIESSQLLGLSEDTKVFCGGVDNSCMALGAKGFKSGRVYTSLGSSGWIAAITDTPLLDFKNKPFVFEHCVDGLYTSATSIFSSGSSFQWLRDNLCKNMAEDGKENLYTRMDEKIQYSPVGANYLFFNPSLAGGSLIEESPHICGGYAGLTLAHTQNDLIRATLEGITYNLRYALEILNKCSPTPVFNEMLLVGGGSNSQTWMQMISDIFNLITIKTNVTQDAASLGAASLAAYGLGYWDSYAPIDKIHKTIKTCYPLKQNVDIYNQRYPLFLLLSHYFSEFGNEIQNLRQH